MPKKFKGENSKAVVAKAKKAAVREEALEKQRKAEEDEYWRDDDKQIAKKQQRKDDKEKKRSEALERKQEAQRMLDEETSAIKSAKPAAAAATKITRAQIAAEREAAAAASAKDAEIRRNTSVTDLPLEENFNRLEVEGEARGVDAAIAVLGSEDPLDRHPEKRVKAAYEVYEKDNLPRLKEENPNMRLSQLKQRLKKDWIKSPDNPLNQRHRAYNEK